MTSLALRRRSRARWAFDLAGFPVLKNQALGGLGDRDPWVIAQHGHYAAGIELCSRRSRRWIGDPALDPFEPFAQGDDVGNGRGAPLRPAKAEAQELRSHAHGAAASGHRPSIVRLTRSA
jgi:hypothetical protein